MGAVDSFPPSGPVPVTELTSAPTLRFDGSASPILYLGLAMPGALDAAPVWQIQQIDTSGVISMKFADGNALFDNVWNDRASLVYA